MHFLYIQRLATWRLSCLDADLTAQSLPSLVQHLCEDVWIYGGVWYHSAWASLMIWKATLIEHSHCSRPGEWSNQVILSLPFQTCCSQSKSWTFLEILVRSRLLFQHFPNSLCNSVPYTRKRLFLRSKQQVVMNSILFWMFTAECLRLQLILLWQWASRQGQLISFEPLWFKLLVIRLYFV